MTEDVDEVVLIRGSRVVLRDRVVDDLDPYRAWLMPGQQWQLWDGPYFPRPTPAEVDAMCDRLRQEITAGDRPVPRRRLAIASPIDDRLLGLVTWAWESEVSDWRRLGIVLFDPDTWSGGLGTEAMALWTDHVFATTSAPRLDFATWSGNTGMCRVGEKLGWALEARFRRARVVRGREYDSVVYGVLRDEWRRAGHQV